MHDTVIGRLAIMTESQYRYSSVVELTDQNILILVKDSCTASVKYDTLSRKGVVHMEDSYRDRNKFLTN